MWPRVRYLWHKADPAPLEILTGMLSASFAVVLYSQGQRANALTQPYIFAIFCTLAAAAKIAGVLGNLGLLRVAGCVMGVFFWLVLSVVFVLDVPGSISWLCFLVLAGGQAWAAWRVARGDS